MIGVLFAVLVTLTVVFYSLSIEVNDSEVNWYFGPGFLRKSLPLEQIAECTPTKTAFWHGFGVRVRGTGWLYNVSGLLAVEIKLKSGSSIWLGTDEPNFLCDAIRDAMDNAL